MEKQNKKKFEGKYIVWGVVAIQLVVSILLGIKLISMNLLPIAYVVCYIGFVLIFNGITLGCSQKKISSIILCILSILVSAAMIYGYVALQKVDNTVQQVTDKPEEVKTEMVVIVLQDSEVEQITDLSQFHVGYMSGADLENSEQVMHEITETVGGTVNFHEFTDSADMIDALYAKTMNAVIMNKAYISMLEDMDEYTDISDKIKIIYTSEIIDYMTFVDDNKDSNLNQFVVYISGIDTYGHVSVTSRSDVNILAVVNTETKQVQLINTPRDYYVAMPNSNGVKDKLTHAGIYGVDNSIGTLEMLYDVEIDYYVRMNFSGFENIIDSLGGIDVYSEYDFTVEPIKHYTVGVNHLSGIEALAFARERHSFATGDIQRGKNQMAVITAMLNKISSPEILYNYAGVLEAVGDSFQTNFTSDEIYALVKMQLADPQSWNIESYTVTGSNGSEKTYTSSRKSYVMIPNETDVNTAKEKIQAVLQAN